jgi:hypothetical protein
VYGAAVARSYQDPETRRRAMARLGAPNGTDG